MASPPSKLPVPAPRRCSPPGPAARDSRWRLISDLLVFQGKLLLDGLRDFVLAPTALVAGLLALVVGRTATDNLFYWVLRAGLRIDRWINLFGAIEVRDHPEQWRGDDSKQTVDTYVSRIEELLRRQSARGGVTTATKVRIDALLDTIQRHERQRSVRKRPGS